MGDIPPMGEPPWTTLPFPVQDFVYRLHAERPELEVTLNGGAAWRHAYAQVKGT